VNQLWSLLFVPHEKNNYRARLLQPWSLSIFIAIYLLNQSIIKSLTIAKPGILGYSSEITATKVVDLTNQERQKLNLPQLRYNPILSESATAKAKDMFANNYWSHNSPQGKVPWDFFREVGYDYEIAGENLAKDFSDTDTVVRAWMKSPTHRDNIVNRRYQEIGVGVVNGVLNGIKTTLVVQHFGTLQNAISTIDTQPSVSSVPIEPISQPISQPIAGVSNTAKPINPLLISKIVGLLMFSLIIGVLFIDGYLTLKNKTPRLTGSSAGHIGFLMIIFVLLLFTRQGSVF